MQENVFIGTELGQPDMNFADMGESMGIKGFRITKASHVKNVLKRKDVVLEFNPFNEKLVKC